MKKEIYLVFIILLLIFSCRQKYEPNIESLDQSFLVVEGNLNVAHDSTIIRLTRTSKLDVAATIMPVNNATLTVEESNSTIHNLIARGNGYYVSPDLNLVTGNDYRLRIKTSNGKEYLSEYVKAKHTPDIDSINWERDNEGVNIFVNTTDPTGNSRYYRWEFEETWEIQTYYRSFYIYQSNTNTVRPRVFPDEDVHICWKYNKSSEILIANSIRLQEDKIYRKHLLSIPNKAERMQYRYSILVKQYAVEKDAYNFFEIMKKNTEEIGSFFAPQPSELTGNIRCVTNPNEPVIGYVTASEEKKQRIFITIPGWGFFIPCESRLVTPDPDSLRYYFGLFGFDPYEYEQFPSPVYYGSRKICVDCVERGGSTKKPSYW